MSTDTYYLRTDASLKKDVAGLGLYVCRNGTEFAAEQKIMEAVGPNRKSIFGFEAQALLWGFSWALDNTQVNDVVSVHCDHKALAEAVSRSYFNKTTTGNYPEVCQALLDVAALLHRTRHFTINWIPRQYNKEANLLSKVR